MAKTVKKTGLGDRIARARKYAGLSQTELGKAFDLTRSAVSQWESETTEPTPANLRAIAVKCGADYDWLATGRGTMAKIDQDPGLTEIIQLASEADPETRAAMLLFLQARKLVASQGPASGSKGPPPARRK